MSEPETTGPSAVPPPEPELPPRADRPPEVEAEPFDARRERGPTVDAPPPGAGAAPAGASQLGPVLCHLSPLLGWLLPVPGLWVVAPLLVWQMMKSDPAVDDQGREAVNFQLNVLAWTVLLPLTCIGVVFLPFVWGAAIVLSFVAAYRASEGERYRYPLIVRLLKA